MDSNITINIVEPGSPTPIDPVVPNTGLFTNGIGSTEATIIGVAAVTLLAIAAIYIYIYIYRKHKQNKLASTLAHIKTTLKHNKRTTVSLSVLAFLVSIGTVAGLLKLGTSAIDTNTVSEQAAGTITPIVSSDELTIELADEPVFAVLPVDITVEEEMPAGYTLTAYTENTDLVSTTDSSKVIPMVAVDEGELAALTDNTYGLALAKPESKDEEVYTTLSTDADNPTFITDKDYEKTEANDTTTIYYGFYITPDTPYGTYTSGDVYYNVEENGPASATVIFDGNDKFYFDGDATITTNSVEYLPGNNEVRYSHTPNVNDQGVQTEGEMYPLDSNQTFVYEFNNMENVYVDVVKTDPDNYGCGSDDPNDYFSIWPGAYPAYTAKANWKTALSLNRSNGQNVFDSNGKYDGVGVNVEGDAVTIAYTTSDQRKSYCQETGYGYYAKVIGYNPNTVVSGEYESPEPNGTYRFLGWSTDKTATTPTYKTAEDIARALDLSSGEPVMLYAISEPGIVVSYNGNGADSATDMDNVAQYTTNVESTSQVDLLASNFKKDGYGFAGWSTDADAWDHLTNNDESDNPTIYGPNQTITVNPSASTKLTLYAVWVPVARNNGEPVELQNWNGCSALDITTYSNGVFTVGKNTVTALKDGRDGRVYTVARLADGNCWMTENLKLDNEPELSENNTHNPDLPLTNNYEEEATSNKLSASSNNWCNSWSTTEEQIACYNHSNLNTDNVANAASSPAFAQDFTSSAHKNFDGNIASYGNYYNWYSATAGNGTYEKSSGNADGDICPKGWRLPTGGSSGEFKALNGVMGNDTSSLGSSNWRSFPNNFVYSGGWNGSSAGGRGDNGYYWSSTANNNVFAYYLYLYSGYVYPDNFNSKYFGYSVRCVAPVQ